MVAVVDEGRELGDCRRRRGRGTGLRNVDLQVF